VIDSAVSAGLEKIAARERDVRGAYEPGFTPESSDAARESRITRNDDPLSVAAPEGAYFATGAADGRVRFTRDGSFAMKDGVLSDRAGQPALGFAVGDRSRVAPLRIDPYDVALGRASNPHVDADGTFAYTRMSVDPRSGERRSERVVVGRVALARFPAGTQPVRIDGDSLGAPPGIAPQFGVPADATFAPLHAHARDLGRMDVIVGIEKMREAYENFEALRAANHVRGSFAKTTMDLLK
jgi:flagellar basal body rod protein FlgG